MTAVNEIWALLLQTIYSGKKHPEKMLQWRIAGIKVKLKIIRP